MEIFNSVLVIIRYAGERTGFLSKKLIELQGISESHIIVVEEVPFSKALTKSFEEGINAKFKWTFCVDADVLLRPGSIRKMIEFAEKMPQEVFEIQGFVMDKFFGGPRPAGNHLYRTSLLSLALRQIPKEGIDIRPESRTLNAMAKLGYPFQSVNYVVGIHDDHQYNVDIFRKCFVQAYKHGDRYNLFMTIWKKQANEDYDFVIALKGFAAGVTNLEEVFINRELSIFAKEFEQAGIEEKPELKLNDFDLTTIEQEIMEWQIDPVYSAQFPDLSSIAPPIPQKRITSLDKLKLKKHELSMLRYSIYSMGFSIKKLGERLMLMIDKNRGV